MRTMNCRSVWREIEETEPGESLGTAARAHLAGCAACEKVSQEQNRLQTIISSLGTVEAPGDFDYRLRARLAGERRGERFYSLRSFSFGLRAAAVTAMLLLVGSAFVFVTFKTRPDGPTTGELASHGTAAPGSTQAPEPKVSTPPADHPQSVAVKAQDTGTKLLDRPAPRRRNVNNQTVAFRENSSATRESANTQAQVIRPFEGDADTYPTEAFPINASYQSLKVSVDDGKGSSRTISLPTVSFGSQRALSQSASPLMASARGVW